MAITISRLGSLRDAKSDCEKDAGWTYDPSSGSCDPPLEPLVEVISEHKVPLKSVLIGGAVVAFLAIIFAMPKR